MRIHPVAPAAPLPLASRAASCLPPSGAARGRACAAACAAAALALSSPARAEGPVILPDIVVSGGLTPVPVSEYGRAFTVVTAEEIEQRQTRYLADVLRTVPGVSISRTGGFGGQAIARLRGAEGNHTLVLIDGVEVNSPESGAFDFAGLLAADIARIEILRGPQSSLYGSNALGGVISITTKRAEDDGVDITLSAEGGSDGTGAGSGSFRARSDAASVAVSVAGRRTDGFDISGDPGGDDDGDRTLNANARIEGYVNDWLTLGVNGRLTDRESDFDGFAFGAPTREGLVFDQDNLTDQTEGFVQGYADLETLGGRLSHRAAVSYLNNDLDSLTDGVVTSDTTSTRFGLDLRTTAAIDAPTVEAADHTVTFALDYQRETFSNDDPSIVFDPSQLDTQSRALFGIAGEYRGTFLDNLDVQVGLRHDFNDDFDDETTYSVGLSYFVAPTNSRVHGSVGRAVQNPTFFEQFGFIPGQFNGNPDLEPEESFGWDLGVSQTLLGGRAFVDVTYFRQDLESEIFTAFPPPDFTGTPFNEDGESERQGVEVETRLRPIDPLTLQLSYTYLDADDFDGTREIRRPRHEGGLVATYSFLGGRASVTADARFVAGNLDSDFRAASQGNAKVKLDDYALVNVAARYRVTDRVEVYGRVENLTNTEYEELFGYETQGITGFAGLRVRF